MELSEIKGHWSDLYFKARKVNGQYYLEGGYIDNTPLRALFEDPDVDEIVRNTIRWIRTRV